MSTVMTSDTRIQVGAHVIDPLNPNPDDIYIEDIANSLCKQCRFTGHLKKWYSVGEHCIRASLLVPEKDAKAAFAHDWSEAYLQDFASPLKKALIGEQYRVIEDRLMTVMAEKFGFEWPMPKSVEYVDNALLRTEHRDLMYKLPADEEQSLWTQWFYAEPLEEEIVPLTSDEALIAFMARYHVLFERN